MSADWFTASWWHARDAVTGSAPGRGASVFVVCNGQHWVLRRYRRGGLIAHLSRSHYLWHGAERSRAFRECRLMQTLFARGLPVPRPIGACIWRFGVVYEGALLTERLPGTRTLAEAITTSGISEALLLATGRAIRRCHDAGLDHVDLNARNLLISGENSASAPCAWLIDFDRCRLRPPGRWRERNLDRLARSLTRFAPDRAASLMGTLRAGYQTSSSTASAGV